MAARSSVLVSLKPYLVTAIIALTVFGITGWYRKELQIAGQFALLSVVVSFLTSILLKFDRLQAIFAGEQESFAEHTEKRVDKIRQNGEILFATIAKEKISVLKSLLSNLEEGFYTATSSEVYRYYSMLISNLKRGGCYWATTFVDDAFWEEEEAKRFLEDNIKAVENGATIIRVFFYDDETKDAFDKSMAVVMHREALASLKRKARERIRLYKYNYGKVDQANEIHEDVGILCMDGSEYGYVLQLTPQKRKQIREAMIWHKRLTYETKKKQFENLLADNKLEHVVLQ